MKDDNSLRGDTPHDPAEQLLRLLTVMRRLRDPANGCPWDVEQTFQTIAPYTIEEAYEVADAIERNDLDELRDELGDLLFQVVFHSRMAEEAGHFDFAAVARAISDKMVRRHPHVFAEAEERDAKSQTVAWEAQKADERAARAATEGRSVSALDGVISSLPAITRAIKLQKRAARVGFDWPSTAEVFDKIDEELSEIKEEISADATHDRLADEIGDLLFVVVNLARHLKVDPDAALRGTNAKFERRFRYLEARLAEDGKALEESSLEEMERLWQEAKQR